MLAPGHPTEAISDAMSSTLSPKLISLLHSLQDTRGKCVWIIRLDHNCTRKIDLDASAPTFSRWNSSESRQRLRGPGMMWEKCRDLLICKRRGEVRMNAWSAASIATLIASNRSRSPSPAGPSGCTDEFISTRPLADLIARIVPSPPEEVRAAAKRLKYRGSSQDKSRG
jgi:hypothetical protein